MAMRGFLLLMVAILSFPAFATTRYGPVEAVDSVSGAGACKTYIPWIEASDGDMYCCSGWDGTNAGTWTACGTAVEVNDLETDGVTDITAGELILGSGNGSVYFKKISDVTYKGAPAVSDMLLIEQSSDNTLRRTRMADLPFEEDNDLETRALGIEYNEFLLGADTNEGIYKKVSALVEEATPASGDWFVMEDAGGAVLKVDVDNMPGGTQPTNYVKDDADDTMVGDLVIDDTDVGTALTVRADSAGTGATVGVLITTDDDDSANYTPFEIRDDSGGNDDLLASVDKDGKATFIGGLDAGGSATPGWDFDDTDDAGSNPDASVDVNCPTENDCDLSLGVNSGADSVTAPFKIDTSDAGDTTIQMGLPGTNYVNVTEAGVMTAEGAATIAATTAADCTDCTNTSRPHTSCIYIEDPTAADDLTSIAANKTAVDWTLTEIWAESDQTVTFMLQIDDGSPADVDSVDLAPAAGEAEDTSLDGDTVLGADEELDLDVASVANTPTWVSICWTYTRAD